MMYILMYSDKKRKDRILLRPFLADTLSCEREPKAEGCMISRPMRTGDKGERQLDATELIMAIAHPGTLSKPGLFAMWLDPHVGVSHMP